MWYVIQVRTGKEGDVVEACRHVVMTGTEEVFVPTYVREKKFHGVMKRVSALLFPGYVFFESDDPEGLYLRLKRVPLLTKILKAGDDYVPLYEEEEALLRRLGGPVHVVDTSKGIIEGDTVKIFFGPLAGMEAQIKKINRHKRLAIVEVTLLGRVTEMKVGLEIVEKRPAPAAVASRE